MKLNLFFLISSIIMIIVVIIGFTPSLIFRSYFNDNQLPTLLIVHGIINISWFALLIYQSWGVYRNKIINHKKMGLWGFTLAAIIILMNFLIIYGVTQKYHSGEYSLQAAAGLSLGNFVGYVTYSIILILAYFYKNKPAYHKRLIYIFSLSLVGFASDRIGRNMLTFTDDIGIKGIVMGFIFHFAFIIALIIYDIRTRRKPHFLSILGFFVPVFNIGLIFYLLGNGYGELFLNFFK